ncbi:MAG TPA: hypothetical protein VMZ53_32895 [Kofleriaceae bacterium]|nr:hypothetical protein [Kofleriaceae bacterium]
MPKQERTTLLGVLSAIMLLLVLGLLYWRHALIVSWWVIAIAIAIWLAFSVALRTHEKTWGKERPVLDWWSVPHFLAGVLFGLFGIGFAWAVSVATAWEGVEIASAVKEYPTNRAADIALAVTGWILAMLLGGGAFPIS